MQAQATLYRPAVTPAMVACVFPDDMKVEPAILDGVIPELVERVEVYRGGAMIRVYSKRYVASLIGREGIGRITYAPTGLRPTCH